MTGYDAADDQAVLILLATTIAFPEEASDALLALGDLAADAPPDPRTFTEYVGEPRARGGRLADLAVALEAVAAAARRPAAGDGGEPQRDWTCEPFRRWALEVSRYSFATGQEVFARTLRARRPGLSPAAARAPRRTSRSDA